MSRSLLTTIFLACTFMFNGTIRANNSIATPLSGTWTGTASNGSSVMFQIFHATHHVSGGVPAGTMLHNGNRGRYGWQSNGGPNGTLHFRTNNRQVAYSVQLLNGNQAMRATFGGETVVLTLVGHLANVPPHLDMWNGGGGNIAPPQPAPNQQSTPAKSMDWKIVPGKGYLITHVYPGGKAHRKGIRAGDYMVAVNGIRLINPIGEFIAGATIALRNMRARVDFERPGAGQYQVDFSH